MLIADNSIHESPFFRSKGSTAINQAIITNAIDISGFNVGDFVQVRDGATPIAWGETGKATEITARIVAVNVPSQILTVDLPARTAKTAADVYSHRGAGISVSAAKYLQIIGNIIARSGEWNFHSGPNNTAIRVAATGAQIRNNVINGAAGICAATTACPGNESSIGRRNP